MNDPFRFILGNKGETDVIDLAVCIEVQGESPRHPVFDIFDFNNLGFPNFTEAVIASRLRIRWLDHGVRRNHRRQGTWDFLCRFGVRRRSKGLSWR